MGIEYRLRGECQEISYESFGLLTHHKVHGKVLVSRKRRPLGDPLQSNGRSDLGRRTRGKDTSDLLVSRMRVSGLARYSNPFQVSCPNDLLDPLHIDSHFTSDRYLCFKLEFVAENNARFLLWGYRPFAFRVITTISSLTVMFATKPLSVRYT